MNQREQRRVKGIKFMVIFRPDTRVPIVLTDDRGFIEWFKSADNAIEAAENAVRDYGSGYEIFQALG